VKSLDFSDVYDFGPGAVEDRIVPPGSAKKMTHLPNLDVSVIELDKSGKPVDFANVILSRDYPSGIAVPVTIQSGSFDVRYLKWDQERSDGGKFVDGNPNPIEKKGWDYNPPLSASEDLVPGRDNAPFTFMVPYPASSFKILVAFRLMRMVDLKFIDLETEITYSVTGETRTLANWMDPMITISDNYSTRALIQYLHRVNQIDSLNQELDRLGLGTLQLLGTRESDGHEWNPGKISMTSADTARLFLIIEGSQGLLWNAPDGSPVTSDLLSASSRKFLKTLLFNQGYNEALCTSNLFGASNVVRGIPSLIAPRWINMTTGYVQVDDISYKCGHPLENQEFAQVKFLHKTGLTYNAGSNSGIVSSLKSSKTPFRRYIISFFSNLGSRFVDSIYANRTKSPDEDPVCPVAYTRQIPFLGARIDACISSYSAQ
jgi:hypothetical protein